MNAKIKKLIEKQQKANEQEMEEYYAKMLADNSVGNGIYRFHVVDGFMSQLYRMFSTEDVIQCAVACGLQYRKISKHTAELYE
jgi:hypothetical protein